MRRLLLELSPKSKRILYALGAFLMAVFCAKAFVINPALYIGKSAVPADTTDYLWGMYALVLWGLLYYTYAVLRLKPRFAEISFGLLFGVLNFFGTSLFAYDSWAFVGTTLSWTTVVFKCLGQAFTMVTGLTLMAHLLSVAAKKNREGNAATAPLKRLPRLRALYRKHTVPVSAFFFFASWVPYMVVFYPGTVIYDMCVIVRQFFGLEPLTTWHVPFTTYVFGGCVWLGRQLGSDNYGTLIYMVLQSVLMAYALGWCMHFVRKLGANRSWQIATLAFFSIVPIWGCYSMMIGKDTLYTATLMLFFLQTLVLAKEGRKALPRVRDLVAYGVTALFSCLWRNNGLYVVLPTVLAVVVLLAHGRQKLRVGAALGVALTVAILFTQVAVPALGFVNTSSSGIYSIPFQQTARVVRFHREQLTKDEMAEIDRVLDINKLASVYERWISDPVKDTFRQMGKGEAVEKEALARYRKTWLAMLAKYPITYIQAFMGNNASYYAFTPKYEGVTYNQQAGQRFVFTNYWESNPGELHTTQPGALTRWRNALIAFANRWWTLPILGYLYVFPFYTWLWIAVGISLAHQKRWRELATLLPALFSFAVCLLSPVDDYLRYYLPIIAMTPPILAYVIHAHPCDEGVSSTELLPSAMREADRSMAEEISTER